MTERIASLGMYDHPAQRSANDRLWAVIAQALRESGVEHVPCQLTRTQDVVAHWRNPDLLLGQACGYPLTVDPTLALRIVAFPVYAAPGCVGATHRSVLVARRQDDHASLADFRGRRAAINDPQSNTGMNLFRATIAPVAVATPGRGRFFGEVIETGSHRASVIAVGTGNADIAAIDCLSYAAIDRFEPELTARLRIVARSPASPTLPFVTAASTNRMTVGLLAAALDQAIADVSLADACASVFLTGLAAAAEPRLASIAALEDYAVRVGYPHLH